MSRPNVIVIGECRIDIWHDHHILATVFSDGLSVTAAANDDPDSVERAATLGYGSTWEMSRDHELLHSLVDVARGYAYSRVLRGVAVRDAGGRKEDVITAAASDEEEGLILDLQRWLNTQILTPRLVQSDLDLDALAAELRSMTSA